MMRLTGAVAPAMQGVNNGAVACCCAAVDRNYGRVGDGFRTINFSGIETFFGASRVLPFRAARHPAVMRASPIEGAIFMTLWVYTESHPWL
jgi:hypothetical protein